MKYIIIPILLIIAIYPLSYARYSWSKKNRLGAFGTILIAVAAVIFPSILLLLR